jgi:ribosomal protein L7/L12
MDDRDKEEMLLLLEKEYPQVFKDLYSTVSESRTRTDIEALILLGRGLEAVRLYRETFGCSLREAKEVVDRRAESLGIQLWGRPEE